MKIAVLNFSGNVGKTTIARDVLIRKLPNYELITIESVNTDGQEKTVIRGEDGENLLVEMILNENVVLDIGSSNLEAFFISGNKEREILDNIDAFIIPTTTELKQQADTGKTIRYIYDAGITDKPIFIIANQVIYDPLTPIEKSFSKLKEVIKQLKNIDFNLANSIERHDLYTTGKTIAELISDDDYKELMEEARARGDLEEARSLAYKYVRQKKVNRLEQHYTKIFDYLCEKCEWLDVAKG